MTGEGGGAQGGSLQDPRTEYWNEVLSVIRRIVRTRIQAQDREDVVNLAAMKFLPHATLAIDDARRYATRVAQTVCIDHLADLQRRTSRGDIGGGGDVETLAAVRAVESLVDTDGALAPGCRILQWFDAHETSGTKRSSLTAKEREFLSLMGPGMACVELAKRLVVHRTRVHQLVASILTKANLLLSHPHSPRLTQEP